MLKRALHSTMLAAAVSLLPLMNPALAESFRLGSGLPTGSPAVLAAEKFADLLRERTKGEVDISIFPDSQLGNDEDLARDLSRGALDFGFVQQGSLNGLNSVLEFGQMPFLVSSPEQADKVIFGDGVVRKTISKTLDQYGIHLLAFYELEARALSNSLRPVKAVSDMKGLRIRVPPSNSLRAFISATGAQPVTVPFGEVFGALQQGLVDGQENGPILLYTSRVFEAQKYLTLLNYQLAFGSMMVSDKAWEKLSPETRAIVQTTADEVSLYQRELSRAASQDYIEKLSAAGVEVIALSELDPAEQEKFRQIGRDTWVQLSDAYGKENIEALRMEVSGLK